MEINQQVLWIWLKEALGYNNKKLLQLIHSFGSVEKIYQNEDFSGCHFLTKDERHLICKKSLSSAWEVYGDCAENGIGIFTLDDALYPPLLREIDNPPSPLFYKGSLQSCIDKPALTVVGTRRYNGYGEEMTKEIVSGLSLCGFTIVCGVANGIDTFACEAALQAGSGPMLVLPFGILSNKGWQTRKIPAVTVHGAVISEIFPRRGSHRYAYHERNRILSGIACGTLVVQAPARSGALMTANYAYEQNRDVFALLANANMKESEGSNQLIKDGCYPVTDYTDILKQYLPRFGDRLCEINCPAEQVVSLQEELAEEKLNQFKKKYSKKLSPPEQAVFQLLHYEERSTDFLVEASGLPVEQVLQSLTALEFQGLAVSCPGSKFKVIL